MNKLLFYISCLLLSLNSFGQAEGNELYDHDLDENKWERIRDGIRYEGSENGAGRQWTYESNKEYNESKRQHGTSNNGNGTGNGTGSGDGNGGPSNGASELPEDQDTYESAPPPRLNSPSFEGLGAIGYVLMAVFVIALVFLIYYMYVNTPKKGKKITSTFELEDVNPTEIPLTELQRLLQEALSKGDYRGAVRIYFIFIIRDLSNKNWIDWEKEKTNFHYLREMSGKKEYEDFNRSVSYFEIIWYGKRELDAQKFEQIKPNFTQFLDKLGVK
ncbi:MAG: hypothetical protein ABJG68_01660 [Crocinitomicaceae bacterium]